MVDEQGLLRALLNESGQGQALLGDAQLASKLRVSLAQLWRRIVGQGRPENPLSIVSMAVLGALDRHGELTVSELAAHEHVQPPSMTRTLNNLELAGCVVRTPHPKDGRAVLVSLTDRGREQLLKDRRRRDAWLTRRLAKLSPIDRSVLVLAAPILEQLALPLQPSPSSGCSARSQMTSERRLFDLETEGGDVVESRRWGEAFPNRNG